MMKTAVRMRLIGFNGLVLDKHDPESQIAEVIDYDGYVEWVEEGKDYIEFQYICYDSNFDIDRIIKNLEDYAKDLEVIWSNEDGCGYIQTHTPNMYDKKEGFFDDEIIVNAWMGLGDEIRVPGNNLLNPDTVDSEGKYPEDSFFETYTYRAIHKVIENVKAKAKS